MTSLKLLLEFLFGIGILINTAVYIPQAICLIQARHAREISLLTFSAFNIFLVVQLIYAYLNHDFYFLFGSLLIFSSSMVVTILIVYFRIKTNAINTKHLKLTIAGIIALIVAVFILNVKPVIHHFLTAYLIHFAYGAAFLWTILAAFPQIITLRRLKDSSELSLITFLGFNFIQIVTIFHAWLHQEWLLLIGISLFLIVYGYISLLIIYYRIKKDIHST